MQGRQARWPWVLGVIVVGAVAYGLFRPQPAPSPVVTAQEARPTLDGARATAAPAAASTSIEHPIAPQAAADAAIPGLADSDEAAWSALGTLAGEDGALGVLLRDHLIQRWVVMIDNLTQRSVSSRILPYRPLDTPLATLTDASGATTLDPAVNARRYAPLVRVFVQIDPEAFVATYRRFYPLFQQAYVELGYRQGYFNDRLVKVIDHLLATPVPNAPPAVAPTVSGRLAFVDPSLESLSVGQKALLRLAPEQALAVKQQLRALRAAITRG